MTDVVTKQRLPSLAGRKPGVSPENGSLWFVKWIGLSHYSDVIRSTMATQITSLTIVCSTVYWRRRSKKTSKLRFTGLCAGVSPVTGKFTAQRASNAEMFPFNDITMCFFYHRDLKVWWEPLATSVCLPPRENKVDQDLRVNLELQALRENAVTLEILDLRECQDLW